MASDYANRLGGARSSLAFKAPCRVATTVNIALTGEQTIDGVAVVAGDRVLVKNQSLSYENGIYVCKATLWVRDRDFDGVDDVVTGTRTYVHSGTVGAGAYVISSADPIVIGESAIAWARVADTDGVTRGPTPASSTDNAIARWDSTTGRLLQDSPLSTLDDNGYLTTTALVLRDLSGLTTGGHKVRFLGNGNGATLFQINTSGDFAGATTAFTIGATGLFGIGTTTPLYNLHLVGNSLFNGTLSGTTTSAFNPQFYINTTDTVSAAGAAAYGANAIGLAVQHTMSTGFGPGNRIGMEAILVKSAGMTGTSPATATHGNYHGFFGRMDVTASGSNDGGTIGSPYGQYFGGAIGLFIDNPASTNYIFGGTGLEVDISVPANIHLVEKFGIQVVYSNTDGAQATSADAAIAIVSDTLATHPGGKYGVLIGKPSTQWPIDPTNGTLFGVNQTGSMTGTIAAKYGIDFNGVTFGSYAFRSNGFSIGPTGGVSASAVVIGYNGLGLYDFDSSNILVVSLGSNLTATRSLMLTTGDADRTLDISAGNVTISAAAATVLDDASVSAMRTTLGVAIGTDVQAYDAAYLSAWTTQSAPTVTASTGSFTSVAGTLVSRQIGKTVQFAVRVTITTNGTAATAVLVALPWTANGAQAWGGTETASTGMGLSANIGTGSSSLIIRKSSDGSYPGADGRVLVVTGVLHVN